MTMEVRYADSKLAKRCTQAKEMQKAFGVNVAKSLRLRIGELMSANRVRDVLDGPGKWHWHTSDDVIAGSLTGNWRLIVRPAEKNDDCTVVTVERVEDYH